MTESVATEHVSRRRSRAKYGLVDFPMDNPRFRTTGEGGMFVKLVVVDDQEYESTPWTICCGAGVSDMRTESFVGDDQEEMPNLKFVEGEPPEQLLQRMNAHEAAHKAWEARHFPFQNDSEKDSPGNTRYQSRQYLASMVIGITGWSGFDEQTESYWRCTRDDLTAEGKALVAQLEALYAGCTIHLLTFLDT